MIVVPPLLISSCVLGLCGNSGSARGVFSEVESDVVEVVVGSPSSFKFGYAVVLMPKEWGV